MCWVPKMNNRDSFSGFHPVVNMLYFVIVLCFTMVFMHPVCLAVSLLCAIIYGVYLEGKSTIRFTLIYMLPLMLLTALINPAFNHEGNTILTYLPSGNPLTMESVTYGIAAAAMLISVILWFRCYSAVMTSDKFIYLFGRVIPSLSLVLSMTLRFIPKFRSQLRTVREAQQGLGRDSSTGTVLRRLKSAVTILSVMVTWALENAIETADSMRSRGYGLPGRTAFSIYRFDHRDRAALLWLLICAGFLVAAGVSGAVYWRYFPTMRGGETGVLTVIFIVIYAILCLTPVTLNIMEDRKWRYLQSEI